MWASLTPTSRIDRARRYADTGHTMSAEDLEMIGAMQEVFGTYTESPVF
jgi:hypothetical protein